MCRLFGFRSVIPSQVHQSLLDADNALGHQSVRHPDGWGVAHYVNGAPHLIRSCETALSDTLFHRVSGVVASETVVAHVRKATQGRKSVLNCHPFQHGRWVFAHNGDVENFDEVKDELKQRIYPKFRRYILGDTDSEVIFGLFLSRLSDFGPIDRHPRVEDVVDALAETVKLVRSISDRDGLKCQARLSFVVTDGVILVAHQGGKELFWSTHKSKCPDRDTCAYFAQECEAPSKTGFVNHLIISSESLGGTNLWSEMVVGEFVGIDARMQLTHRLDPLTAPDGELTTTQCS
jgi:glutamine amidotransferase